MGKLWLALILLVSSLGSAPVGSMEQGAPETIGRIAHLHSQPAARPTGEHRVVERQVEPHYPHASGMPPGGIPLPQRALPPALPAGAIRLTGPPATGAYDYTPLCERLPYDATAPPAAA